jgi:hypothetical protein
MPSSKISMSRRLPHFTLRKIWAGGAEKTHGEVVLESPSASTSFGANSGYKSMPSSQTSDKVPHLTLRKIWAGGPEKGKKRGEE